MGIFDDISKTISSSTPVSVSLPGISIPGISIPTAPSTPSSGVLPSIIWGPGGIQPSSPLTAFFPTMDGIRSSILGPGISSTQLSDFTQFQQDFNSQLTSLSTKFQQSLAPFLDKITDVGALMELLSNPETIIIIVAVVAAIAVAVYLIYKFYMSKVTYGEGLADKYTEKGLEAAKILK